MKSKLRLNASGFSIIYSTPHFANTMLYAVLFFQYCWKYARVAVGNLFFFGGGKKREGKSSFAVFGFAAGGADCKCAFSCGAGVLVCIMNFIGRIVKQDRRFINSGMSFIKYRSSYTNSNASFMNSDRSFINSEASFIDVGGSFTNFGANFINAGACFIQMKKSCLFYF